MNRTLLKMENTGSCVRMEIISKLKDSKKIYASIYYVGGDKNIKRQKNIVTRDINNFINFTENRNGLINIEGFFLNIVHFTSNINGLYHNFSIKASDLYTFIDNYTNKHTCLDYCKNNNNIILSDNLTLKNIISDKLLKTALKKIMKRLITYNGNVYIGNDCWSKNSFWFDYRDINDLRVYNGGIILHKELTSNKKYKKLVYSIHT